MHEDVQMPGNGANLCRERRDFAFSWVNIDQTI